MTVTVLSGPERRRRWTTAEKLRIVQESLAPDAIINEIARRYDIHPHQLHAWRQQTRRSVLAAAVGPGTAGESGSHFVPVAVATGGGRGATPKDVGVPCVADEISSPHRAGVVVAGG